MSIKQTKIFTLILLILTTSLTLINITYALDINDTYTPVSNIDYTEDISNLRNPERGFYEPRGYNLKIENNQPLENVQIGLKDKSLIHLKI